MHIKCVNVSKDDYFFLKNEGKSWYCGPCAKERRKSRLLTPLQTSQSSEEQTPGQGTQKQPYETLLEIIEEIREDINKSNSAVSKDIDNLRSEVKDLTDNLNKYADIINENTTALGEIKTSIDTLANKFDDLKVEVTKCQSDIEEMKTKSNELEQQTRENIIEIVGVPSSPNEDLIDIMKKIGVGINLVVKDEMVSDIYRTRPNMNLPGIIIVEFVRKIDKRALLLAAKSKELTTHLIGLQTDQPNSKIYINNSLTYINRRLLKAAKDFKNEHNYRFVWVKNGKIMLKKSEDRIHPPIVIRSSNQLLDIKRKDSNEKTSNKTIPAGSSKTR
ncbi:hypothetical protein GE061_012813 [Apolygus lucorum]|uniref:FP protein C-terminal domain-containing protein n=1 Tax=Apolygus lucorum TaxID=248454 RepID=A0A6A4JZ05_APOLU|nr:hypothetical protein GE061_012813 [Apolygus lucorum]